MSKAIWRGAAVGGATGVVVSFVWSYRRDDTVDMAFGRAARMGVAFAATGALLGCAIENRGRSSTPAPRWTTGRAAGHSLERGLESLGRAAEVARPRVEHAVEVARPRVEHAVEVARPRVEQAWGAARVVASNGRRRGWGPRPPEKGWHGVPPWAAEPSAIA